MEWIYQNITKKVFKYVSLLLAAALLITLPGCGMENAGNKDLSEEAKQAQDSEPDEDKSAKADQEEEEPEEELLTMAKLLKNKGNHEEVEQLPDTILWFNATYAVLTYTNGGNWRLVGGLKPTAENQKLEQSLLLSGWGIRDRKSALETADKLKKEGHRKKYQECQETLQEMGMLELTEEEFWQALEASGIEENLFRYVMVYYMYQDGADSDMIAAWDLCRLNELYASFYVSGYMSYEEAMDASLENSLLLQQLCVSWEDMVASYLLGYQFWQSDPAMTDDSPTLERYRYYEMLLKMEDGPYALDWDTKLEKCW